MRAPFNRGMTRRCATHETSVTLEWARPNTHFGPSISSAKSRASSALRTNCAAEHGPHGVSLGANSGRACASHLCLLEGNVRAGQEGRIVRTAPLIGRKAWFGPRRFGWGLDPV